MNEMLVTLFITLYVGIALASWRYVLQYRHKKEERLFTEYQQLFDKLGKMIDRIEKDVDKKSYNLLSMEIIDIYYRISLVNPKKEVQDELVTILEHFAVMMNDESDSNLKIELTDSIGKLIAAVGKELGIELSSQEKFLKVVIGQLYVKKEDTQAEPKSNEKQYVWINTAVKYFPKAFENMLKQNVASTYGPKFYGNLLRRVRNKDIILLYHSGTGIIAKGAVHEPDNQKGQDAYQRKVTHPTTIDKKSENEYQVKVNWDIPKNSESGEIGPIVSASQIKEFGHRMFVPTVQYLDPEVGKKIVEELQRQ